MSDITVKEMVNEAKRNLKELSVGDVKKKLKSKGTLIVYLRDTAECIDNGVIPGSYHVSRGILEFSADPKCEHYKDFFSKEKDIILYCHTGSRSALASATLKYMGYKKITHMKGGFKLWMEKIGIIDDYK